MTSCSVQAHRARKARSKPQGKSRTSGADATLVQLHPWSETCPPVTGVDGERGCVLQGRSWEVSVPSSPCRCGRKAPPKNKLFENSIK